MRSHRDHQTGRTIIAIALLLALPFQISAESLRFDLPIQCDIGTDCFIQNFVDIDPGPGQQDYQCGSLTYDDHKGTDFRVLSLLAMNEGVPVVAAADGVVIRMRTGVDDEYFSSHDEAKQAEVYKIGLGNVVILRHRQGYFTTYGHMKKDSVRVKKGQRVKRGQVLGYVGLSGFTDFPHVHFALQNRNGVIDPFSGPMDSTPCNSVPVSLWTEDAAARLDYQPTGFLSVGFADTRPDNRKDIETGYFGKETLTADSPLMVLFSYQFGLQASDVLQLVLVGPDGQVVARSQGQSIPGARAISMNYVSKPRPAGGWPVGTYTGESRINRGDEVIRQSETLDVVPPE